MTNKVYIIQPLCHGNGGWHGSTIWKECDGLPAALAEQPEWEPVYSPWGGSVLNRPRVSLTKDPNDAIYVYDWDDHTWEQL